MPKKKKTRRPRENKKARGDPVSHADFVCLMLSGGLKISETKSERCYVGPHIHFSLSYTLKEKLNLKY